MGLRSICTRSISLSRKAPTLTHLPRVVAKIERTWGPGTREPDLFDLDAELVESARHWQQHASWTGLPRRRLNRLPSVLFHPANKESSWLANDRRAILGVAELTASASTRFVSGLLQAFLYAYPRHASCFEIIRAALAGRMTSDDSFALAEWRRRCTGYGLLQSDGPSHAAAVIRGLPAGAVALADIGATGTSADGAFVKAVCRELLAGAADSIRRGEIDGVALALRVAENEGRLRWPTEPALVADPLLLACKDRAPGHRLRGELQSFLVSHIGDPRLPGTRGIWESRVNPQARAVMLQWLVGANLEAFFRIVSQDAKDSHWKYRKAFWRAYFDAGFINEAWVILGRRATAYAERTMSDEGSVYGTLLRSPDETQSALLMRIGELTILEWSHNGSCRVWSASRKRKPSLYESRYPRVALMLDADLTQAHYHPETYAWQKAVAGYLRDETQANVPLSAYKVR